MFRALLTSDVHCNNNTILGRPRLPVCRRLFSAIVEKAVEHKCSHIILLGDVWHAKHPAPEVVLAVCEFLEEARANNLTVVILLGNHDVHQPGEINKSLLRVFDRGLAQIVDKPRVSLLRSNVGLRTETDLMTSLFMLPWYESDTYKQHLADVKKQAAAHKAKGRKVVLLTHVGLSEGKPSLSNFQPPQRVSLTDIEPKLWDLVLMGDYHMHQKLADNAMYLGSPIPHTFGDEGNVGFWLMGVNGRECVMSQVPVGDWVPQFDRITITDLKGVHVPYKKGNYTRIECAPELYEQVRKMYPEAEVLPLPSEVKIDPASSRISVEALVNYPALIEEYMEMRRVEKRQHARLKRAGLELLQKARPQ